MLRCAIFILAAVSYAENEPQNDTIVSTMTDTIPSIPKATTRLSLHHFKQKTVVENAPSQAKPRRVCQFRNAFPSVIVRVKHHMQSARQRAF